jgi:molybdopterin synthase catalytic subunit
MAELVSGPIHVERLVADAARADCGAIALFLGTTRDQDGGRRVVRLAYEAYAPMTLVALRRIERAAVENHGVASCHIVHRLGEVPPGEASVAVVVVAAHRAPAFDACRWAMDELKRSVPIWKKQCFADGGGEWAPGKELA